MCVEYVKQHVIDPYVFSVKNFDLHSRFGELELSQSVYADDHTTANRSTQGAQHSCNNITSWLFWTRCMAAKPKKSRSLGMSLSELSFRKQKPSDKTYSAFNPDLSISQSAIAFIGYEPMPYVGRHICADLSDTEQRSALTKSF